MRALLAVAAALLFAAPAQAHEWPSWGNEQMNDCTFAAAANWELAALGHQANEAEVIAEFHAAGGGTEGLSEEAFARYWRKHGIAGVRATLRPAPQVLGSVESETGPLPPPAIRANRRLTQLLRRAHFLLASLSWDAGHEVLLTAASPAGVTLITWGEERTLPWREWDESDWGVYVVVPVRPSRRQPR